MKYFKRIAFLLCLTFSHISFSYVINGNYEAKWSGIEVIGTDNNIEAEKIRQLLPIRIGETLIAKDAMDYKNLCCNIVKEKTSFEKSRCSILFYGDNNAYFIIDLASNETMYAFRTIPQKSTPIPGIPKELDELYEKWNNHASSLMSSGNFIKENFDNNFRDFEEPSLHLYAMQLNKMTKKYNNILLDIIHYSESNAARQKVADLLSWGDLNKNIHYLIRWNLLNDPDPGVRNNIARAFLHSVHKANEALLKDLIHAYCYQSQLPTHGDRNKALFSLKEIIEAHPHLGSTFSSACKNNLIYLSEMSILDNIKEPANDILAIINKSPI
ncbi:MAG: hypothetical protein AB7D28_05615 [Candidatus Berkiella sp.]